MSKNRASWAEWIHRNLELSTLLLLAVVVGTVWAFAELTDEVLEGSTSSLDRLLLMSLRDAANPDQPAGPWWLQEIGRDLTGLGGVAVLTLATLGTVGFFVLRRAYWAAAFLTAAVSGGIALSSLAKEAVERPRPDLVAHGSLVETSSFPSGHSMMAAVVYLTLGAMIARSLPKRRQKIYVLSLAILLTILVGISRVYLGVHWPTDVLAGWLAGAGWAMLCVLIARYVVRRRDM